MYQTKIMFQRPYPWSRLWLFSLGALIWLGALAALVLLYPQYRPDGEVLFFNDFEGLTKEGGGAYPSLSPPWHYSRDDVVWEAGAGFAGSAGIKLTAFKKGKPRVTWDLPNPQRFSFLEFRGKMRSENIVQGERSWHAARFIVFFKDKEGKSNWDHPHVAGQLSGSSPWREFSEIFQVPAYAVSAHIMIQNNGKSGTMWCDDLFLGPVRLNPQYFWYRNLLLGLGLVLAIAFVITFKAWRNGGWLAMVMVAIIILGVLCPEDFIEMVANTLHVEILLMKKIDHLSVFFVFGAISSLLLFRRLKDTMSALHAAMLFIGLSVFASITEFMQALTTDRSPAFSDWLIDVWGIFMGISLISLTRFLFNKDK